MADQLLTKHRYASIAYLRCFFVWCIPALAFVLASCAGKHEHDKAIFRYNEVSGIASLDPAFARNQSIMWGIHQVYNTLIEVNDSLQLVPSLAKSWTFSNDKTEITFVLRNDVFFHDDACFRNWAGRKLVAQDVVFSFNRIINAATASPGAWIFNNRVDSVSPFTPINDSVFVLKLQRPFQPILGILSMQYCSIVPEEAVNFYGDTFRAHPVGTGPFKFVAWEEGQGLVFTKNLSYFEKDSMGQRLPYLDGIKVNFYDSKATEFLEFQQKRLDFINDIDPSFKDEVLTKTGRLKKEWEGTIELQKHPYLNIEYLGILLDSTNPLVKNSPLRYKKFRQAINYGIDRTKMMLYLRNSIGTPATSGFVPQGLPSFNAQLVKGYDFDPGKARALLAELGYSATKKAPAVKVLTIPIYANLASYIANELQQVGITLQVEVIQKSLLLQQTAKSEAAFFRGSWIADYPDAENYLSVFYGNNPAPPNYTRYKNPVYDKLYEQALQQTNDSLRYNFYRQMDNVLMNDAPVIPLWYDMVLHLVQKDLTGFVPNSLNMLELRHTKKMIRN